MGSGCSTRARCSCLRLDAATDTTKTVVINQRFWTFVDSADFAQTLVEKQATGLMTRGTNTLALGAGTMRSMCVECLSSHERFEFGQQHMQTRQNAKYNAQVLVSATDFLSIGEVTRCSDIVSSRIAMIQTIRTRALMNGGFAMLYALAERLKALETKTNPEEVKLLSAWVGNGGLAQLQPRIAAGLRALCPAPPELKRSSEVDDLTSTRKLATLTVPIRYTESVRTKVKVESVTATVKDWVYDVRTSLAKQLDIPVECLQLVIIRDNQFQDMKDHERFTTAFLSSTSRTGDVEVSVRDDCEVPVAMGDAFAVPKIHVVPFDFTVAELLKSLNAKGAKGTQTGYTKLTYDGQALSGDAQIYRLYRESKGLVVVT